jgi:DNA-binding NarL/FixJ family response regulator
MAQSRIVVVDDFKDWRRKVCSILELHQQLLVVGEASDGVEAVQKAGELQPELIVLDIGPPKLNGIEAAPRIAELSRRSKIPFLSQDNDARTIQAALGAGAWGMFKVKRWNRTVECYRRSASRPQVCQAASATEIDRAQC